MTAAEDGGVARAAAFGAAAHRGPGTPFEENP